jgi:hypothetical protein
MLITGITAGIGHAAQTGDLSDFFRVLGTAVLQAPAAWVIGAIALLLFGLLIGLAMLRAAALLRAVEGGQVFPARPLRGFALWLFLTVLFAVLGPPLLQLASGTRHLVLSLGGGEALMLLLTGLLFFVARLLDEAQRLADDHSQIV